MEPSELKLLLCLNGNKRLQHLEAEIFTNRALSELYLMHMTQYRFDVCYPQNKYNAGNTNDFTTDNTLAWAIHYYASAILTSSWPEAEPLLNSFTGDGSKDYIEMYKRHFNIK